MIIVTGGAGFIGSCLLWRLNEEGLSDIMVVDEQITPTKKRNIEGKKINSFLDKDNFLSLVASGKLGKKVDTIFHLGACTSTTVTDMEYLIKNKNVY